MREIFLTFKFKTLLLLSLSAILMVSCGKKSSEEDPDLEDKNAEFFAVVYKTQASRIIGSTSWIGVQGIQRLKFEKTSNSEDTSGGNFTVQFDTYKEPQLANQGLCSGGFSGTFTIQDTTEQDPVDGDEPYDPMSEYNPGITNGDATTNDTGVFTFLFTLNVTQRSFASGCSTSVNPQDSFQLRIIRYPNGDLIVTNSVRNLDHYFIPELIQ